MASLPRAFGRVSPLILARATPAVLVLAWLVSRGIGMAYITVFPGVADDVTIYGRWAQEVAAGRVPYVDFDIEYPPGILPLLALPSPSLDVYRQCFFAAALVTDALVMWTLSRSQRPLGSLLWLGAPLALGAVFWSRLDIFVAGALVLAVVAAQGGRWRWAAAALVAAASLKLWPMVLLAAFFWLVPRGSRTGYVATAATATGLVVLPLVALGGLPGLRWMLEYHEERGVSPEALAAVLMHGARIAGDGPPLVTGHGAVEFPASSWPWLLQLTSILLLAGCVGVLWLALRLRASADPARLMLLTVTTVLVFSKVLSPQYVVWVAAAAALVVDGAGAERQRKAILVASFGLLISTQYLWPIGLPELLAGSVFGYVAAGVHAAGVVIFALVVLRTCGGRANAARHPPAEHAAGPRATLPAAQDRQ
jgi:hypothetical protein